MALGDDTLPYPIRGCSFRIPDILFYDSAGAPVTSPTVIDTELEKDYSGGFVDCTDAVHDAQGVGHLDLTSTEMTCDVARILNKGSNFQQQLRVLRPRTLPIFETSTTQTGSTTTSIILNSAADGTDDFYNGTIIKISGNARIIVDYNGTTKAAALNIALNIAAPGAAVSYDILETEWSFAHKGLLSEQELKVAVWGAADIFAQPNDTPAEFLNARLDAAMTTRAAPGATMEVGNKTGFSLVSSEHTAIADKVKAEVLDGTEPADSIGKRIFDNLNITVSSRATPAEILLTPANLIKTNVSNQVEASSVQGNITGSVGVVNSILAAALDEIATRLLVTPANKLKTDAANRVEASSVQGNVTGSVASVTGDIGGKVTGNVDGSVGSLATQAKADVKLQISDYLAIDNSIAELATPPTFPMTYAKALSWWLMGYLNKRIQSGTLDQIHNAAGIVVGKHTTSEVSGTLTIEKVVAGP